MAKVVDALAIKQLVWIVPSQSCKIQSLGSNLTKRVNKIASHPLKQRSVARFKMRQIISQGMDGLQARAKHTFRPFGAKGHGYTSLDSSLGSPMELVTQ